MVCYEFDGEKYKQASKHQKEWGNALISGLNLSGNESILDIGCGDGVLTEKLATLVPNGKVVGIDASLGMIDTANKLKRENLSFIQMNAGDIDFKNEFDVIYSNAALHWVKDHSKLLQAAYNALKANGAIAWNFAGMGTCTHFIDTIITIINKDIYKEYFFDFEWPWFMPSKAEYEALVAGKGFKTIKLELENADRFFKSADEMMWWIDQPTIVPFLACVADGKKDDFRDEVVDMMINKTLQPDSRCFETFNRINLMAKKLNLL